jgi:hypothetical protein
MPAVRTLGAEAIATAQRTSRTDEVVRRTQQTGMTFRQPADELTGLPGGLEFTGRPSSSPTSSSAGRPRVPATASPCSRPRVDARAGDMERVAGPVATGPARGADREPLVRHVDEVSGPLGHGGAFGRLERRH